MTIVRPAFRALGTSSFTSNNVANPTSLTPGLPTRVRGDVLLCFTWSRSISATVSTPSGWTLLSGFPLASGTSSGGKVYVFARVVDGGESAPTVTWTGLTTGTSGDASGAVIASFSGLDTSRGLASIIDGSATSSDQSASTTTCTIPSITTLSGMSLRIAIALKLLESSGATWTPPSGFTEFFDLNTTTGTGHWVEGAAAVVNAIGSTGTTTAAPSVTTSSRALGVSFSLRALRPARKMAASANPAVL